ncbi:hypothetical protein ACO0RG_003055 [Hanseniaspora osmophila]|uniref:Putative membrane protein n=1 Tax=Hanseniaspora osmophila TaxID=56408 RepID=A0A1E5REU0_9ASCO|nr:putative membrane protein [Hanseniaspora osmophila]
MKLFTKYQKSTLVTGLLFLSVFLKVHAHEGHEEDVDENEEESNHGMDMVMPEESHSTSSSTSTSNSKIIPTAHEQTHMHGMPILEMGKLTPAERLYWEQYNTTTYFTFEHPKVDKTSMWFHVYYIAVLTVFVYPILLGLNNIGNKWYLPLLGLNYIIMWISSFCFYKFHKNLEKNNIQLYPNNIMHQLTCVLLGFFTVHLISAFIRRALDYGDYNESSNNNTDIHTSKYSAYGRLNDLSSYDDVDFEMDGYIAEEQERENGSKSITSPPTTLRNSHDIDNLNKNAKLQSTRSNSNNTLTNNHSETNNDHPNNSFAQMTNKKLEKLQQKRDSMYHKLYSVSLLQKICINFHNLFNFCFHLINYPILMFLFVYCGIGLAVGNIYATPKIRVFNLLAHWIKGGVFIMLGLVSLSRYCGFGKTKSWAWNTTVYTKQDFINRKMNTQGWWRFLPKSGVNMDFIEVFLICFYGTTNVFLEHLASEDGKWTAKDLQHVSIAFMYIGSGACGLLVEYYLNDWKYQYAIKTMKKYYKEEHSTQHNEDDVDSLYSPENVVIANPGFSPNPLPAFTIFWTGVLMSKHAQASQVSTAVHVQWGNLLAYGSFFRIFTILYMFLVPNYTPLKAVRPLTELVTSFCLLCGGLIFMESTDQVIEGMEYRGYTEMFTFNLSVGGVTLLMSWIMLFFILKDWLKKTQSRRE